MAKKYAAAEKIEVRGRVIPAGAIVTADDFEEADGLDSLVEFGALEAFDEKVHGEPDWQARRYNAEIDKATVKAGGLPRVEAVREIRSADAGGAKER